MQNTFSKPTYMWTSKVINITSSPKTSKIFRKNKFFLKDVNCHNIIWDHILTFVSCFNAKFYAENGCIISFKSSKTYILFSSFRHLKLPWNTQFCPSPQLLLEEHIYLWLVLHDLALKLWNSIPIQLEMLSSLTQQH